MNRQTLLIITGGFFMAILVAITIQFMVGGKPKGKTAQNGEVTEYVKVLVASKTLEKGEKLKEKSMKWQKWPKNAVFTGAIVREEDQKTTDALSGMLRRNIAKGEPLQKTALVPEDANNFLAATLQEGMRAIAITVNASSSVGGFVTPGDRVDVILTYKIKLPRDEELQESATSMISKNAAQTILQNVRILAIDQNTKKQDEAKLSRTVTLEVDTRDAEVLALASAMGKLSLTLRKLGDENLVNTAPKAFPATTDVRLSKVMQEMLRGGQSENNAGTSRKSVRIYNGSSASDIPVHQTASY